MCQLTQTSTKQNNNKRKINCKVERNLLDEEKGFLLDVVHTDTQQQVPMKRTDDNENDSDDYDSGGDGDGDGDDLLVDLPTSKGSSLSDADDGSNNNDDDYDSLMQEFKTNMLQESNEDGKRKLRKDVLSQLIEAYQSLDSLGISLFDNHVDNNGNVEKEKPVKVEIKDKLSNNNEDYDEDDDDNDINGLFLIHQVTDKVLVPLPVQPEKTHLLDVAVMTDLMQTT